MDWISGIGRNEKGRLCTEVQSVEAERRLAGLEGLSPDLKVPQVVRRATDFRLDELRPGDTASYLDALGFDDLDPSGQPVYEVDTAVGRLVIPAQLLILATLGMNNGFRGALLRPWGPRLLMTALAENRALAVRNTPNRMLALPADSPTAVQRMRWVLTFPSADACWGSVYRNALKGTFDLSLPKAEVRAALTGRLVDRRFLVTRLKLMTIRPDEAPHPFADQFIDSLAPKMICNQGLYVRHTHGKAAAPTYDAALVALGTVQELSDEQWARVEPLVLAFLKPQSTRGAARNHTIREMVEAIRLKLGTPYSWSQLPVDARLMQGATVLLSKLKRGRVWDSIACAGGSRPVED